MARLGPTGLTQLLTDIKTWITTKLGNYVTTDTTQTVTGKKYFTNSTTQVNSVNTFTGSTLFIDTSASAPRGSFPESAYRVGRIYIGDGTSYNGSWFIIDPTIDTNRAYYRMVTTNPDNTDSTRFTIEWNGTLEGARRRRNISMGDLLPQTASTYNLGESGNAWQDAYINKIHGISDYTNLKTNSFNVNTTLTHGGSGRRVILAMGAITLTVPAPEEGSWFLIKAVNGLVTLNLASNVTVTGITAGVFSGPIYLQPNESILLCYYSSTTYNATISTIRRSGVVGRTGNVPSENPKHWFKIAENYVTATYRDPFICLRVFEGTTGNTIGTLCAHCRINNTIGVVDTSNCYLQWQDAGAGFNLSKYALTTNETSGTGVTISLWCQLLGGYSSLKFEVVSECGQSDQLGNPEWVLVRRRQTDGDLAELLDTDFTKIVYSTLTTLKNDTTGNAKNVTGTVAIANGGTGATTRLSAVKNLTNESVGTPTHFLAITTNWGKAGYTTVAQAKTVLGITGDMGSHSDSEYVHKTGDESITGTKTFSSTITGSISGNAGTATQFSANKSVTLTGDVTGTASSKAGWSVATTLANSGVTAGDYGPSANASPSHGGTFSVPYVTVDAKGRVTAASTKTITLPADSNTDTKVTQTVTTGNSAYPVLLCATANATATGTTTSRFSAGLTVNTRYSSIYITNKYDTANTKGVRNTSSYNNGILYFRSYDATQMGLIRCDSHKSGYQHIYMQATNYIKDGAIDPEGTATTCSIAVRVRDNGSKTIYTDGSWENSLTPYANNTHSLGTSSLQWKNAYAVNIYENGTALSSKYALNENFGKGMTTYLYINVADFPTGSGPGAHIQYNDAVDGTKLYVWYSVCNSSSILDIHPTAAQVATATGQVWRYLGPTIYAGGLGPAAASPTGILGLFRRES